LVQNEGIIPSECNPYSSVPTILAGAAIMAIAGILFSKNRLRFRGSPDESPADSAIHR
jgi:hypothetical protein